MPQFCLLFYAILQFSMPPLKYVPDLAVKHLAPNTLLKHQWSNSQFNTSSSFVSYNFFESPFFSPIFLILDLSSVTAW